MRRHPPSTRSLQQAIINTSADLVIAPTLVLLTIASDTQAEVFYAGRLGFMVAVWLSGAILF